VKSEPITPSVTPSSTTHKCKHPAKKLKVEKINNPSFEEEDVPSPCVKKASSSRKLSGELDSALFAQMEALRKELAEERAKREEVTKDLTEKLTEARYKLGVCEGELRGLEKGMAGKR
jgi:hypothetical protein